MEKTALLLIAVTLLLLVIIVGLLALLVFKMFRQNHPIPQATPHPEIPKNEFHPAIMERMKEMQKMRPKRAELFCPNHPDEPGETVCSICDHLFCKACIKPYKSLYFCKEHLPLIMRHDWSEVMTVKTATHDPERGVKLYDVKKEMFETKQIPTYIETHYKINVDQDYIETYLVMFGINESVDEIKTILSENFKD